jgi:formamidopyrimidine-DNA glycosylase
MPELPEVETIKRGLSKLIINKKIKAVSYDCQKSFPNSNHELEVFVIDSSIISVHRRAKVLLIELSSGYTLMTHLKMTGQLVFRGEQRFGAGHPNDSLIGELPDKSTRVEITFYDDSRLFFNDQRKFGWIKIMPTHEVQQADFIKKLGPEPLLDEFTPDIFINRIRRRSNTVIKAAILDQSVLAGVGNIYADESLWGAKIHPATRVKDVSDAELNCLYEEIRFILGLSIEKGGSTDKNYVNAEGKRGSYIDFARVFRKEGSPCSRCGTIISKTRVAQRGTHVCSTCQVAPFGDGAK